MTIDQKPILHGRDHMAGGPDPIPGVGTGGGGGSFVYPGHRKGVTENRWYFGGHMTVGSLTTDQSIANDRHVFPFIPAQDMTLDKIAVQVTTLIASSNMRLGIYADDGNLYPAALLVDAGTVSSASTGVKSVTISVAVTQGTLYWLCSHSSHGSIQRRCIQDGDNAPILGVSEPVGTTAPLAAYGWFHNTAFGSLPDPFPAGASPFILGTAVRTHVMVRGT